MISRVAARAPSVEGLTLAAKVVFWISCRLEMNRDLARLSARLDSSRRRIPRMRAPSARESRVTSIAEPIWSPWSVIQLIGSPSRNRSADVTSPSERTSHAAVK
jgi:hypothetical protein